MATIELRGSGDHSYVFVHGSPSNRHVYDDLAALAPSDAAVVLVDLPDHGEAPDDLTASLPPLEDAVLEAVEAAPGEVTVVGHSVGAWLVAATSSRMPERARRFVAICGMSRYAEPDVELRRNLVAQLESGALEPAQVGAAILGMMCGAERSDALDARLAPMLDLSAEHWLRLGRRAITINDRPPVYFERPALVVHATGDQGIPLALGEELARGSGAKLVTIETSSHMLTMTHPRELAEIIYPWGRVGR